MLEVPNRLRSVSFQSNEVKGALNSLFLFCNQSKSLSMLVNKCEEFQFNPLRYITARLPGDTCTFPQHINWGCMHATCC